MGKNPVISDFLSTWKRMTHLTKDAVHERMSKRGASIRMGRTFWSGYHQSLPKEIQQVVIFASGVTGIAPMLQAIYTLIEARRGDGIVTGRIPDIRVVWFKKNAENAEDNGMTLYDTVSETSTVDKIAAAELQRLRSAHLENLVIESVDVGSSFTQTAQFIASTPRQHGKLPFFFGPGFQTAKKPKVLIIPGSKDFAESMASYHESGSCIEDGPGLLDKAKEAG